MYIDLETKIFSRFINIKKHEYNYNPNYYCSVLYVFKNFIFPIIYKKYEYRFKYSFVTDKSKIKTLLNEVTKKVEFESNYDDFHKCFNFSFSVKARKNIIFKINHCTYKNYKKFKIEISKNFYKRFDDVYNRYNTLEKYNKFKEHFSDIKKLINKNIIIEYDMPNCSDYKDDSSISNMYLECNSKIYDLKIENYLNDKINIEQNIYYDENLKKTSKTYRSYFFLKDQGFEINIKHSLLDNKLKAASLKSDDFWKDLSNIIINLSTSLNISLDDLNENHIKLADISSY